jgi:5-methylcytosine-specific restriction endonuclease McrA
MFTLVVNQTYEPVGVVAWEKAIELLVKGKADVLVAYDRLVRSVSLVFALPKVVRLRRFVQFRAKERGIYRKREVFERDSWSCQYCGAAVCARTATIDHVVARSRGGPTSWTNTVTACRSCNFRKADRTLEEAGMTLRTKPARPPSGRGVRADLQRAFDEFMTRQA